MYPKFFEFEVVDFEGLRVPRIRLPRTVHTKEEFHAIKGKLIEIEAETKTKLSREDLYDLFLHSQDANHDIMVGDKVEPYCKKCRLRLSEIMFFQQVECKEIDYFNQAI